MLHIYVSPDGVTHAVRAEDVPSTYRFGVIGLNLSGEPSTCRWYQRQREQLQHCRAWTHGLDKPYPTVLRVQRADLPELVSL